MNRCIIYKLIQLFLKLNKYKIKKEEIRLKNNKINSINKKN